MGKRHDLKMQELKQRKLECYNTKHYKQNMLKKRIARVMRFSNSISVLLLLIAMVMVIGTLTAAMGMGFSLYTANQIAEDTQDTYIQIGDKDEFIAYLEDEYDDQNQMSDQLAQTILHLDSVKNQQMVKSDIEMLSSITYFEYQIMYGEEVVYDSYKSTRKMNKMDQYSNENLFAKQVFTEVSAPYFDSDNNVIGKVMVRVSPDIINMVIFASIFLVFFIFIINMIISKIITVITSRMVARPLEILALQMENMANEDLEDAFNAVLDVKKPVSEVNSLTESTTKIMKKMSDYYQTMMAQNQELEAQRDTLENQREELEAQKDELESQNDQLLMTSGTLQSMNDAYLSRTLKLQNLLDNVGQGFMTFGSDLIVNSEYSVACSDILYDHSGEDHDKENKAHRHDIQGEKVTDLLFDDEEQREFIESLLVKIIDGTEQQRNLFIPLLPDELNVNRRVQSIEYKLVKDENFKEQMMVILTDITHTRELEEQMELERDVLQMIVKVLLNRDDFLSSVVEFKELFKNDFTSLEGDHYEEMLRSIHTFKGTFAQYYMTGISNHLNELEDHIYHEGSIEAVRQIDKEEVLRKLNEDMSTIESYVGFDFLYKKDMYTINEDKILEIEQKIKRILPATEFNNIIPIIQSIRYRSVKEGLKSYPDYVTKLSERMNKSILPFEIQGDDVFVDFNIYQNVFKTMVHLFRNAVDHGIEDIDGRLIAGKSQGAAISCTIVEHPDGFDIVVEDDGRGIKDEIKAEIFKHGFSTKDSATAISGRGVGLPALKEAVEALGGIITLDSKEGAGSRFIVSLPLLSGTDIVTFEPEKFLARIESIAGNYFNTLNFKFEPASIEAQDKITLHRVNALLNMKGSIDGMLIVSANELFARDLVGAFVLADIPEESIDTYAEDVLGEVTNTILGNVLGSLEEEGVFLSIGVPVMLSNKSAYIKYTDRQILSASYKSGDYMITLSLLITEGNETLDRIGTNTSAALDEATN
ncbi:MULTISPECIES: ATP-binding protein [unclassified Fusibacter]|uniref:ATP-binding protein n=1 Tax=unclassified Fusibacter TaxID=2624464 RepID=UPI0010125EDB|nr:MULTISPECIES: ATP-binding protein [unclassified Fusibacter]MCK8058484.1 ATP-binding protein [Fusibacter sp. A2]NPE22747.1 hypothetical protein [Fusibacter sp. A1]RXV60306.1 hypothetical protein DWB64_12945 [Fusibacter sp. A1]